MEVNNNSDRNISQHHQKEEEDMDPFKVRLKFSFFDYLKMGIFGVTILPFKLLGSYCQVKLTFFLLKSNFLRHGHLFSACLDSCNYWNARMGRE